MRPSRSPTQSRSRDQENRRRSVAEQACTECRRRKSKCDRVIPICALCRRFTRRCVYEKQTKTPLTRRYLTEVESELARTKAQLRRYMPGGQSPTHAAFSASGELAESQHVQETPGPSVHDARPEAVVPAQQCTPNGSNITATASTPAQRSTRREPGRLSPGPSTLSLETPPSASNFEWDERTGKENGDRFIDGMASLTSNTNEGGYLGMASGAALLRITDTSLGDEGGNDGGDRRTNMANAPSVRVPFALTSLSQLEPFVDAYFSLYHQSYPIIHEATFRAQFMEVIPRPAGDTWQVLLFVLAAIGAFTASTQPTDVDLGLFEAAKARLSIEVLETGNMLLVQVLTLISNYMQKRNKPNSGYNYMGLARRIAMGIGLHKEFPTSKANLLTIEVRRRVWYCLYIFDVGAIITFSRPFDFPNDGVDVELPMNVHDSDLTSMTKRIPQTAVETTVYSHLLAQAKFHMATSPIYARIISSPFPSASELIGLDDRLIGHWLATIPSFFQEAVVQLPKFRLCHSILRWRYRNFRILMYRPFLVGKLMRHPQQGLPDIDSTGNKTMLAIQRCWDAASESVELISTFWTTEQNNMMACWYGLYFLFQAILIPVISLRNDPQCPLAIGWRDQILKATGILESMGQLNPTALRCLRVIRSLCGTYLDSAVDGWGGPTEESPQTQLENLYPLMWPTLEMAEPYGNDPFLQESTIIDFMNRLPG